jgi:pimeloyl-ACP methyl ester carboxylesterase
MYSARKRKSRLTFYLKFFIPAVVVLIVGLGVFTGYAVNTLTHPKRALNAAKDFNKKQPDDWGKVVSLPWKEVSISTGGTTLNSWVLLRGPGLPGIVIAHGFDGSRSNMIDLGYRLWERGYNVMIIDQRAHGENTALISGLGALEKSDLAAAVKEFKAMKVPSAGGTQVPLVDPNNLGLYGVDIGAFAALMVGGEDDSIKAVVADTPSDSVPDYVHTRSQQLFGLNNFLTNGLIDFGLKIYLGGKYDVGSVSKVAPNYKAKNKQVAVIVCEQPKAFRETSVAVLNMFDAANRERIDQPLTRTFPFAGKESADKYNDAVCTFFSQKGLKVFATIPALTPVNQATVTTPAAPAKK